MAPRHQRVALLVLDLVGLTLAGLLASLGRETIPGLTDGWDRELFFAVGSVLIVWFIALAATGSYSLRHLRAFPIDILKIDGAFTQNLRRSTDDRFYVRTLVELAGHLGVETVAEWVDDEMQASMLRDWGVTYLQGHLVGRAELHVPAQLPRRRLATG